MSAADHVIGGLLLDSSTYWRIAGLVIEQDFPPNLRPLFAFVRDTLRDGQECDAITAWDAGHKQAVTLANETYSVANIETYARLVAEEGERQRVREAGRHIAVAQSYSEAQALLAAVRPNQAQRVKTVKDGVSEMLDAMQLRASGPVGLSWGVPELDQVVGKLVGSRVYGIAARAKMGKTTLSLRPQIHAVLAGKRVLNFSLEMTVAELTQRALASIGQFSHDFFERDDGVPDEAWPMIHRAAKEVVNRGWLIDDQPGLTMDQITGRATQLHMEEGLDLIVLDHMGLVHLPRRKNSNRNDELGEVSYGLKNLSKKLNVPILALLQLNRNLESRMDKRPTMPDIRDSGNIEQDFDAIVGIYRDEVYNPQSLDEGHAEIIALANRHRKPGTAFVRAHMETMTYGPAERAQRCFPERAGSTGGRSAGGGFASFGAPRRQPREVPMARGDGRHVRD